MLGWRTCLTTELDIHVKVGYADNHRERSWSVAKQVLFLWAAEKAQFLWLVSRKLGLILIF